MKNIYFSKKIIKNIKEDRQLGILCFSMGKKIYVLSLRMPPFIGSNDIRKKKACNSTEPGCTDMKADLSQNWWQRRITFDSSRLTWLYSEWWQRLITSKAPAGKGVIRIYLWYIIESNIFGGWEELTFPTNIWW